MLLSWITSMASTVLVPIEEDRAVRVTLSIVTLPVMAGGGVVGLLAGSVAEMSMPIPLDPGPVMDTSRITKALSMVPVGLTIPMPIPLAGTVIDQQLMT